MLTQIQQNKLKAILDGKVASVDEFTAFELTKLLRKSEYVMHSDVRDYVHSFMTDYISLGEYERTIYNQDGWSAYKYIPKQETDSSTDSTSNDNTLIDNINDYFSDVDNSIVTTDSDITTPRVIGATTGSYGIVTSTNGTGGNQTTGNLFDDSDTRNLSDLISEEFKLQSNNRINISEKIIGTNVDTIYVYLDNSDMIVITNDILSVNSPKTRPHKISKSQKSFRFTLNPYISNHKKKSIDYNICEIQDVEEHSKGKFSLFLDVY